MADPAEQTTALVLVHGGDAKALVQLLRWVLVANGVCHGDLAHCAATKVVEGSELREEGLAEAPDFGAVEHSGEQERRVHLRFMIANFINRAFSRVSLRGVARV